MATIKITENEFPDVVVMFLMDYIMGNKTTIKNERFDDFIDKMGAGIKPKLLKYYIGLDAIEKSKYKEIKGIFSGNTKRATINIIKDGDTKKENPDKVSRIKNIVKKVFGVVEKKKKKCHGMPLSEEVITGIIENIIKNEEVI